MKAATLEKMQQQHQGRNISGANHHRRQCSMDDLDAVPPSCPPLRGEGLYAPLPRRAGQLEAQCQLGPQGQLRTHSRLRTQGRRGTQGCLDSQADLPRRVDLTRRAYFTDRSDFLD